MTVLTRMRDHRWSFSVLGVLALWGLLSVMTSHFNLNSLSGVASSASFLMIVAIGQMFVIASGSGNIDLSIPSVITVSAFVTMILSQGTNSGLLLALPAVIAIGLVTGAANAFLVLKLRIPAIIATLAIGYVLDSATLIANRSLDVFTVSTLLRGVTSAKLAGVPVILILASALMMVAGGIIKGTTYGRTLMAVGQNATAAHLAGARTGRTITIAFLASSLLGAVDGALLSAHAGGAFLQMGEPYLLQSVGAVVVGGTLIAGGSATALGTFFGSILLVLVVTTMQVSGWSPGMQEVVQGAIIIAILAAAGSGLSRRSA
ncbi:MAG: ABC transporter permease [Alphaproteobacteria bacterium]|nr:ABC transporter permease [Alphaproteobacteria bacterium]